MQVIPGIIVVLGIAAFTLMPAQASQHPATKAQHYAAQYSIAQYYNPQPKRKVRLHHNTAYKHKRFAAHKTKPHRLAHKVTPVGLSSQPTPPIIDQSVIPLLGMPEDRFSLLADYAYSEVPPPYKPADRVKEALDCFPEGSVRSEIALIADTLGLSVRLMDAFAEIESDFNPHERTGSYVGLYQLSMAEFRRYGPTGGDILNSRDNAIAAALKIEYEANLFKIDTRHIPSNSDLYLIHQQGTQGAAEHLADPDRLAWQSMCATDEGKEKGPGWCKKAIWGNTLPAFKRIWKTVNDLTSRAFVQMWASRVAALFGHITVYVRAANASTTENRHRRIRRIVYRHSHRHHHYAGL